MTTNDHMMGAGSKKESAIPAPFAGKRQLKAEDELSFGCHAGLPCFNTCCHDVNIILTPVDVLRLSRRLKMSTTEFIGQHTLKPITKELQLPVLMMKMSKTEEKACPFLTDKGCGVYEDRPWACRMYPIAMAVPPARAGDEEPEPIYFLLEDDFCKGHGAATKWTVEKWRRDQGVVEHEDLEKCHREIHSHPWFIGGIRHLNPSGMEMFFMCSYDLDTFKRFIFNSSFLERFDIEEELVEKLRTDDVELLKFGSRWLRYSLFQEPIIKVREDAPKSRRKK